MTVAPYVPESLPPDGIDWERHIPRIAAANRALARYDGILQAIPNPDILLSPLLTQEAVLSSDRGDAGVVRGRSAVRGEPEGANQRYGP